jgi:hypothetical protein
LQQRALRATASDLSAAEAITYAEEDGALAVTVDGVSDTCRSAASSGNCPPVNNSGISDRKTGL